MYWIIFTENKDSQQQSEEEGYGLSGHTIAAIAMEYPAADGRPPKEEINKRWIEILRDKVRIQEEFERKTKYHNKGLPPVTIWEKATNKRNNQFNRRKFEIRNKQKVSPPLTTATVPSASSHQNTETSSDTPCTTYPTDGKPVTFMNWDSIHTGVPKELITEGRFSKDCTQCDGCGCWWSKCDFLQPRMVVTIKFAQKRNRKMSRP